MMWSLAAQAAPPAPLVQALSARHGVEDCKRLEAHSETLEADLNRVVREVTLPPWAPMNAAICLIEEHHASSKDALLGWVQDPQQTGLARLVFRRVNRLPDATAIDLMQHALNGPHREEALVAAQADTRASIRALRPNSAPTP